ncbi:MAG: hypothetical protein WDM71_05560 [Ferruginibacter sp.]
MPIETALTKLKDAHKAQDLAAIDASLAELNNAWTAASEEIYKAQQAGGQPQQDGQQAHPGEEHQQGSGSDNVEDAQFEEVK